MKKFSFISLLCAIISINLVVGQAHLNPTAILLNKELSKSKSALYETTNIKNLIQEYDLTTKNGIYYIGALAIVNQNKLNINNLNSLGIKNDTRIGELWTFRVPIDKFSEFANLNGIEYIEIGSGISPDLLRELPSARVDSVHMGLGGLSQSYTGKNVVVAIIDWGFDYTHPNFYDTTLTHTRIVKAWDQNKLSGPAPAGYSFGTEYAGQAALFAAQSDTDYVFGPSSHGTHVAGIAAGNGVGTDHRGVAYEAELIFISLRRDAPSFIDAISYIANYAASVNKPFVVNMSFGTHLNAHDGSCLKNFAMDMMHGPGKIFVGSAGNNGGNTSKFHLDKDFSINQNDTLTTVVDFTNYADQFGQTLSMWGSPNSDFEVSIIAADNQNNILFQTPFYSSLNEPFLNDTIIVGTDSLIIRILSTKKDFLNHRPNIRMEIRRTGALKIVLKANSENSHLHIWNNVRMNNRYTNWGVPLSSNFPSAIEGNFQYGLGEPAGTGKNVITVASYQAELFHPTTGNMFNGYISSFSSWGPTIDYRQKPDIASTGENVVSSINSFDPTQSTMGLNIQFNGKTYGFRSMSGTSMSGPMVTGIVALMLESFPKLSAIQAKEVLRTTARLDDRTGNIGPEGHLQWGFGKANALAAVLTTELLSEVKEIKLDQNFFTIYPNPTTDIVYIKNSDNKIINFQVEIYSIDGKLVKSTQENSNLISLDIRDLKAGTFIVRIKSDNVFSVKKLQIVK